MRAYERLLKYVTYPTSSDPTIRTVPSNPAEWDLARDLAEEMRDLGLEDVTVDTHCYVMGTIPATIEEYTGPVLGLVAHIDVSDAAPCKGISPHIVHYEGGDLIQNDTTGATVSIEDYPFLAAYAGLDIITSDGTTLLGADDKAGVAEIMTMAEQLLSDRSLLHGPVRVCFTPDEEVGRGTAFFDLERFAADVAYTVDGDAFGRVEAETFNAISATVRVKGFSIHPGSAKGKMINACRIAGEFDGMIPDSETPEHTEGREGFYHLCSLKGNVESAEMDYIIRDHDLARAHERVHFMRSIATLLNERYGKDCVDVSFQESYRNMREVIEQHPRLVALPCHIIRDMGREPSCEPIRGGTDGAELSMRGLPCPNLGVGAHNFHGRKEFAVIQEMDHCVELLCRLAQAIALEPKDI